ncbi:alpha-glucosidase [Alginatibacterium sediminis]|uniref:Alpha-glucosidase n=1 Tax=Alginatibacterium sediminis TaxID=2164068 RepID=A0A420E6D4_9ALTE|nr:alpha-glucosidase [Alginatibacterium sediminis]RKF13719.1 alpha-glucosidase [Alginatibacterium sediminis]
MFAIADDPKWWHSAVVYQIYPRSFNDSNGDGIGDIPGIIQKLDYIQTLGVNVIWLSPVYKSPMDDNGYDISDYCDIAPEFGNMADMDELIAQAKVRGIKIVMDLVVNHSSDEHPWFIESKSSLDNPKRDWYIWKDPKADGSAPNNWDSFFTPSAWELDETTGQYYLHLFSKKQPDLNWANTEVRQAIYEMMHFWLKKGLGGFRMDVINMIGKPADYPDATIFDQGVAGWEHWSNNVLVHQYLREMNQQVLSHYDVLTVGETPFTTTLDGRFYSDPARKEVSMIFTFEHMGLDREEHNARPKALDLTELKTVLSKWQDELYNKGWNSVYWNNHDQARCVSRFGNDSDAYRVISAKMLGTLLHGMSGTPYVYQGEELGMCNKVFSDISQFDDLMAHFHYKKMMERGDTPESALEYLNHFSRDHARIPVQWDGSEHAGFTTGTPWLAVNDNFETVNAQLATSDENSIYYHYQHLINLRRGGEYSDTLVYGKHCLLQADDPQVYAYTRSYKGQTLLIVANFTDQQLSRDFGLEFKQNISNNYADYQCKASSIELKAYQACIFVV